MHILNQVQVNLVYNMNRNLFLWMKIFIPTRDLYNTTADRWSCHLQIAINNSRASNGGRFLCIQISREWSYPLPTYWYQSKGNWSSYNFAGDSFYIMKLCSRLFILYCRNCPKDDKFRYLIPILRKLGAAYNLGWWLVGKPVSTSY